MDHPDPGAGLKAEVVLLHVPIQDLPNHLAHTHGHGLARVLDPIHDLDPGAEAGHVLHAADHGQGPGPGRSLTPQEGGAGPDLGVLLLLPQLAWALIQHHPYLIQDLEKKIKDTRC